MTDLDGLFDIAPLPVPDTLYPHKPIPFVWSYGMGADSTGGIIRTILDPQFRHPCILPDLSNLTLVTAQTGDEFHALSELVECHVLPLLRAYNIRLVEVARAGPLNEDGIVVLQDTRQPYRMHFDPEENGFYPLSGENRINGILPQKSGNRKCTLKFKGWPMDIWREAEFGSRPYFHAIGYNADEARRIAGEAALDLGGQRQMVYPIHDAGMTRQNCREYLFDLFGVWWPKSLCRQCPFLSKHEWPEQLSRFLAEPEETYRHVVDEYVTLSLNARSGMFGVDDTLTDRLRAAGAQTILDLAAHEIRHCQWALYRVRRVYFAPATAWRSVDAVHRGSAWECRHVLDRLATELTIGPVTDTRDHTRLWLAQRPLGAATFPHVECFFVAAPAHVADKQRDGFEKHWLTHSSDEVRELDMAAADHLYHRRNQPNPEAA